MTSVTMVNKKSLNDTFLFVLHRRLRQAGLKGCLMEIKRLKWFYLVAVKKLN